MLRSPSRKSNHAPPPSLCQLQWDISVECIWQKDTHLLPNKGDMSIVVCNWQNQNGWTTSVADFAQGSAKFGPYTFFPRTRDQKEQNESRSVANLKLEQVKNTSWWTFYNASKFKGEQTIIVMSISICVCQTFIDMRISVPVCKTTSLRQKNEYRFSPFWPFHLCGSSYCTKGR